MGSAQLAPPKVGPNVNMVWGTRFPEGDPFLTKQNEPSIAVSSRNPRHLLAASNDYRQVPVLTAEGLKGGKAWNTLYKSVDGGTRGARSCSAAARSTSRPAMTRLASPRR